MTQKTEFRVSLPHKIGQLALMCDSLNQRGVQIKTIAGIAAAAPVIALVTENNDATRDVLKELGLEFKETELLSIQIANKPGEIANFANILAGANTNIESIYLSAETESGQGEINFTTDDPKRAKEALGI